MDGLLRLEGEGCLKQRGIPQPEIREASAPSFQRAARLFFRFTDAPRDIFAGQSISIGHVGPRGRIGMLREFWVG